MPDSGNRTETISVNIADKIDEKMRDHVGDEIAPPEVEDGENYAKNKRNEDVGPTAGPVPNAEDRKRNYDGPNSIQP